jgi:hypothetical protein
MRHITAPTYIDIAHKDYTIFLGGSIEMGRAEPWQDKLVTALGGFPDSVVMMNPRRADWDSSLAQDPTPGTQFHEQVTWELEQQELADIIIYYFDPATQSPITLMELGAYGYSYSQHVIVCCPPSYYRYGNVAVFCARYGITLVHTFTELLHLLIERILDEAL